MALRRRFGIREVLVVPRRDVLERLDRDGLAIFEVPVGLVLVAAWDASTTAAVDAVETATVELALEGASP
jgi:hypothetical protein